MGLSFASWFRVLNVFRPKLTELMMMEYGASPDRFRTASDAMNAFMDGAMGAIGEEYLRSKEAIIREQSEAIRELRRIWRVDGHLIVPDRARCWPGPVEEHIARSRVRGR